MDLPVFDKMKMQIFIFFPSLKSFAWMQKYLWKNNSSTFFHLQLIDQSEDEANEQWDSTSLAKYDESLRLKVSTRYKPYGLSLSVDT